MSENTNNEGRCGSDCGCGQGDDANLFEQQRMSILNPLAEAGYAAYCEAVGGKAFNGDPLPDWATFSADEKKQLQVEAWRQAAAAVVDEFHSLALADVAVENEVTEGDYDILDECDECAGDECDEARHPQD